MQNTDNKDESSHLNEPSKTEKSEQELIEIENAVREGIRLTLEKGIPSYSSGLGSAQTVKQIIEVMAKDGLPYKERMKVLTIYRGQLEMQGSSGVDFIMGLSSNLAYQVNIEINKYKELLALDTEPISITAKTKEKREKSSWGYSYTWEAEADEFVQSIEAEINRFTSAITVFNINHEKGILQHIAVLISEYQKATANDKVIGGVTQNELIEQIWKNEFGAFKTIISKNFLDTGLDSDYITALKFYFNNVAEIAGIENNLSHELNFFLLSLPENAIQKEKGTVLPQTPMTVEMKDAKSSNGERTNARLVMLMKYLLLKGGVTSEQAIVSSIGEFIAYVTGRNSDNLRKLYSTPLNKIKPENETSDLAFVREKLQLLGYQETNDSLRSFFSE